MSKYHQTVSSDVAMCCVGAVPYFGVSLKLQNAIPINSVLMISVTFDWLKTILYNNIEKKENHWVWFISESIGMIANYLVSWFLVTFTINTFILTVGFHKSFPVGKLVVVCMHVLFWPNFGATLQVIHCQPRFLMNCSHVVLISFFLKVKIKTGSLKWTCLFLVSDSHSTL